MKLFKATTNSMHYIHNGFFAAMATWPVVIYFSQDWKLFWIAIFIWQVFMVLGYSVGAHRYFSHETFECNKFWQWTMAVVGMIGLIGPPCIWAETHLIHHQHSDTKKDPYRRYMDERVRLVTVDKKVQFKFLHKILKKSPIHQISMRYYWLFVIGGAVALTSIGMAFGYGLLDSFYWFYVGPAGGAVATIKFILLTGHVEKLGYRTYATGDRTNNWWFASLVAGGEGWHNNHHHDSRNPNLRHKWWEFDIGYQIIKVIRK